MKKLFTTIVIAFLFLNANSQAPSWVWAKSIGSNSSTYGDWGKCCATDMFGNLYVAGNFDSDSITFGTTTLFNQGEVDFFIVKYSPAGNVIWARSAGGILDDDVLAMSTDLIGNIYITGSFLSSSIILGTDTFSNAGGEDFFIIKYDGLGNLLWGKTGGGSGSDLAEAVATDYLGNIFIAGRYHDVADFGATTLSNPGTSAFLVKYDSNGNVLWAKSSEGSGGTYAKGLAVDSIGNIYLVGNFYNNLILDGNTLLSNGSQDVFFVKFNSLGNIIWAKRAGGSHDDAANAIALDQSGNIYITGIFYSATINFGALMLNNAGYSDVFLVKYDAAGNVIWAKKEGGTGFDLCRAISTDNLGNIYISGNYQSSVITFGTATLSNIGEDDIFVTKYNTLGNVLWAKSAGGPQYEFVNDISIDGFYNVYITGGFTSPAIAFGLNILYCTLPIDQDAYVAKLGAYTVGVNDALANLDIPIYPNPSNGMFNFKDTKNLKHVEVYNLLGEQILSQGNQKQINLSGFAKGIYYARINGEVVVKLVKD